MKRLLAITAFCFLQLPTWADTAVESLLVRRQADNVNIRVTVTNPGVTTQAGPITVTLYARPNQQTEWAKITSWNNISKIPKGNRVSRDYFDENNAVLKEYAASGTFEVRAVVNAPGGTAAVEKVSGLDNESGQ